MIRGTTACVECAKMEGRPRPPRRPINSVSFARGGIVPARNSRVLCEYIVPASEIRELGIGSDWLARLNAMPVSKVRGKTRGRHRARRYSLRANDVASSL